MSKKTYLEDFKGTPGKWQPFFISTICMGVEAVEDNCKTFGYGQVLVNPILPDTDEQYDIEKEEIESNVKLMAASKELLAVLVECDDYLKGNTQNYIGNGSILHRKMKEAIKLALK